MNCSFHTFALKYGQKVALTLSVIGILLSAILLFNHARRFLTASYLGFFFLGISLYGLYYYILINSKSVAAVRISMLMVPFAGSIIYLIGPLFYWYVRSVLNDNHRLGKRDLWHFLPMLVYFIAGIPAFFISGAEREATALAIVRDAGALHQYRPTLLSTFVSYPVLFLSRPVLVLAYVTWSAVLFFGFLRNQGNRRIIAGRLVITRWLLVCFGSLFTLLVCHILDVFNFTLHNVSYAITFQALQTVSAVALAALLIVPFFSPAILFGLPRSTLPEVTTKFSDKQLHTSDNNGKKPEHRFKSDYMQLIGQTIERYMQEQKPYLLPDCNLASFSKLSKLPAHHLAYYFREIKKQSFNDFRNEWRIRHAKDLIKNGRSTGLTLEGIGLASGFSSRNAFFMAFKKVEGIPPGSFTARFRE